MDGDGVKKKRTTERQLTRENYKDEEGDNGEEEPGEFERASEEKLKTRQIRRVRRAPANVETTGPNPFAGISLTPPTAEQTPGATAEVEEEKEEEDPEQTPETPLATQEEKQGEEKVDEMAESGKQSEMVSLFGSGQSLFGTPSTAEQPASTSTIDPSRFKPLDNITSGEESEETMYCEKAALFSSIEGKWKTVGRGEIKINVDPEGEARLIMRQDITLKLLLNARLYPEIKALPMGEDAVTFACQNSVPQAEKSGEEVEMANVYDILALRFKAEATEKVESFVEMIEKYKSGKKNGGA